MSVLEAMAREYDAKVWGLDPDAGDTAIRGIRAALAEARRLGWQLVPVEPTEEMFDTAGHVLWGNPRVKADEWAKTDKFESWATFGVHCYRAMVAAAPSIEE